MESTWLKNFMGYTQPSIPQLPTLEQQCLEVLGRSLSLYMPDHPTSTATYRYILGPFNRLNGTLVSGLLVEAFAQ